MRDDVIFLLVVDLVARRSLAPVQGPIGPAGKDGPVSSLAYAQAHADAFFVFVGGSPWVELPDITNSFGEPARGIGDYQQFPPFGMLTPSSGDYLVTLSGHMAFNVAGTTGFRLVDDASIEHGRSISFPMGTVETTFCVSFMCRLNAGVRYRPQLGIAGAASATFAGQAFIGALPAPVLLFTMQQLSAS